MRKQIDDTISMLQRAAQRTTAVIWDVQGTPTALPPPPGAIQSLAFEISERGDVVGIGGEPDIVRAVVWE